LLDLDPTTKIEFYAVVWLALLLSALARGGDMRGSTVGLPLAFILSYTFVHSGALVHLVDGYDPAMSPYLRGFHYDKATVAEGLEASCLGMIGATCGFVLADQRKRRAVQSLKVPSDKLRERAVFLLFLGGAVTIFTKLLAKFGIQAAGMQAVLDNIGSLFVTGSCCFIYYKFMLYGEHKAMITAAIFSLVVPAFILITTGILADSVSNSLVIVCFYLSLSAKRAGSFVKKFFIISSVLGLAFVFAGAYLQSRHVLRSVISGGEGSDAAVGVIVQSASNFDPDSLIQYDTLALFDARLDQNIFVGLAIQNLRAGSDNFEDGATIGLALLGWVPRFLWPDKPGRGGSTFLAKHTGLQFSQDTTFGAGPVFEFYVNFGYPGVFFGFVVLGFILRRLDIAAFRSLRAESLGSFAQYQLMGVILLGSLADLFFLVTSIAVALLVGLGLRIAWSRKAALSLREAGA